MKLLVITSVYVNFDEMNNGFPLEITKNNALKIFHFT